MGWCGAPRLWRSLLVLLLGMSVAWAESDGSRSHVLADRKGGALGKQLDSIRALERQRKCGMRSAAGLFDPCRALAARRSNVERQMAWSGGAFDAQIDVARASLAARERRAGWSGLDGRLMLYCVRLSDGYFFPAPNAQFVGYGAYDNTLDRCRFICRDPAMDVYVLDDPALETDTLRRLRGGMSYAELPVAFSYREDPQRYVSRSNELQTEADLVAAAIPLPKSRPLTISADSPVAADTVSRPIRVVGLPFLPDNNR
jgi:Protein of unknown function (DUF2865)